MTHSSSSASPPSHSSHSSRNLPRGKACMKCRRRKIKCDGRRPVCSQCLRSPGNDQCAYPLEGRSRTQQLEETVIKLQSRIAELEAAACDGIRLHEPYEPVDVSHTAPETPFVSEPWLLNATRSASPASRTDSPASASSSSSLILEEPPHDIAESLVDAFLDTFTQAGFFLNPTHFRQSALLRFPSGHHERPSPALLSVVYTWGARLSPGLRHHIYNEDAFLVYALQNIHQDLGGRHPHRLMHTIQAEVLLSVYYLSLGRPVEGIYHSGTAVSLVVSAGLHRINPSQPSFAFGVLETPVPPPSSALEEAERINGFWMAVLVNNYWVAAHGAPSALPYTDASIDTPWPCALDEYASDPNALELSAADSNSLPALYNAFSRDATSTMVKYNQQINTTTIVGGRGGTVTRFLGNLSMDGFSPLALLTKASILLERATTFSTRCSDHSDARAFDSLDALLEQFAFSLPVLLELGGTDGSRRSLDQLVTQSLAHAAVMRLHTPRIHTSDASRRKALTAARAVVHLISTTELSRWRHIDPIMGVVWKTTCDVFISQLSNIGGYGGDYTHELSTCGDTVLSAMRAFSASSPLIEYLSSRVQQSLMGAS